MGRLTITDSESRVPVTALYPIELLTEHEKDGRKVTGENGLRIILNGSDVEELGIDERLTFELRFSRN